MFAFLTRRHTSKRAQRSQAASMAWQPRAQPLPTIQRSYVDNTPYLLPKDAQEDSRLNFQHHALYRTLSNHYLAPISPTTHSILDVGCGTGIWVVDMAALFPQAQMVGVDVALTSLPRPLPERCVFAQGNILDGLSFPDEQFEFVHQRLLVAGIPARNWPAVVGELVRVTRSQGWVELLEVGDTIENAGSATKHLLKWMTSISREFGFEVGVLQHLDDFLREAGCEEVTRQDIPVPLGAWAGPVGEMLKTDIVHGYLALKDLYCLRSQTPPEAFDEMLQAASVEWETRRASYVFHLAYGRRK